MAKFLDQFYTYYIKKIHTKKILWCCIQNNYIYSRYYKDIRKFQFRYSVEEFRKLSNQQKVVFEKQKFEYLFGKNKPVNEKYLIKMINKDLKETCKRFNIPFNVKSHSFRINMITNLLKVTSVQHTADIIGHEDIRSTMKYNRYAMSKSEIQNLLDQINQNNF